MNSLSRLWLPLKYDLKYLRTQQFFFEIYKSGTKKGDIRMSPIINSSFFFFFNLLSYNNRPYLVTLYETCLKPEAFLLYGFLLTSRAF